MKHLLLLLFLVFPLFASAGDPDPQGILADKAYEYVKTAGHFAIGGVGIAGVTSRQEAAFRLLLTQPEPVAQCQKLLTEATPAGQFYGLLGLRLLDQKAFAAALPAYENSKADIPAMSGCIAFPRKAADLASKIEKGEIK